MESRLTAAAAEAELLALRRRFDDESGLRMGLRNGDWPSLLARLVPIRFSDRGLRGDTIDGVVVVGDKAC